jgi:transcription elongation factor Elf1
MAKKADKHKKDKCPFCGNKDQEKLVVQQHVLNERKYVSCCACGANGPDLLTTESGAIGCWNGREE